MLNKRILKEISYSKFLTNYPHLNTGSFLVVLLCVFLIIASTFTQIPMFLSGFIKDHLSLTSAIMQKTDAHLLNYRYYLPQIPAILFIGAFLGNRVGMFTVIVYFLIGIIGFPIFAAGGGLFYYLQPGFGYILGYFLAVFAVGHILAGKITDFSLFRATIVGVLAVHLVGIIYLTLLLTLQHNSIFYILGWIYDLSAKPLPYDLIFGFSAVCLARPARSIFWIAMD